MWIWLCGEDVSFKSKTKRLHKKRTIFLISQKIRVLRSWLSVERVKSALILLWRYRILVAWEQGAPTGFITYSEPAGILGSRCLVSIRVPGEGSGHYTDLEVGSSKMPRWVALCQLMALHLLLATPKICTPCMCVPPGRDRLLTAVDRSFYDQGKAAPVSKSEVCVGSHLDSVSWNNFICKSSDH